MTQNARTIGFILSGIAVIVALTLLFPTIWDTKRTEHLGDTPSTEEKFQRLRACLEKVGLVEGAPDGDFQLKPVTETVDGVTRMTSFFILIPDRVLNNEELVLKIEACKKSEGR